MRSGELARRAEITRRHLTTVENGNRQGSWELLYRIARELDVDITDILTEQGREELNEVGAA
jgi:transcriptional regulator with XRE-family HTH domain